MVEALLTYHVWQGSISERQSTTNDQESYSTQLAKQKLSSSTYKSRSGL